VCQTWRMKANEEEANFTRKDKEHYKFCVQISLMDVHLPLP